MLAWYCERALIRNSDPVHSPMSRRMRPTVTGSIRSASGQLQPRNHARRREGNLRQGLMRASPIRLKMWAKLRVGLWCRQRNHGWNKSLSKGGGGGRWRREVDSSCRWACTHVAFQVRCFRPHSHPPRDSCLGEGAFLRWAARPCPLIPGHSGNAAYLKGRRRSPGYPSSV